MRRQTHLAATVMALFLGGAYGCRVTIEPAFGGAEEDYSRSVDVQDAGSLTIDWRDGTIDVRIDPDSTGITATGTKRVTAESTEDAANALAEWTIELAVAESDPPQVFLRFNAPTDTRRIYSADVSVVLPAGLTLSITADDGVIIVSGNDGSTTISLDNGSVAVTDHQGDVTVTASNASIEVDSTAGAAQATVGNGNISIDASPPAGGSVVASADIGSIAIRTPGDFAAELSMSVNIGIVRAVLRDFTVDNLEQTLLSASATLNGGGGTIQADVGFGDVTFGSLP